MRDCLEVERGLWVKPGSISAIGPYADEYKSMKGEMTFTAGVKIHLDGGQTLVACCDTATSLDDAKAKALEKVAALVTAYDAKTYRKL